MSKLSQTAADSWLGLEEDFEATSEESPGVPSAGQNNEQLLGGSYLCADSLECQKL